MPSSTVYKFDIGQDQLDIVKATLPLVAKAGPDFTKHFYKILFQSHPELKNLFNQTNQAKGKQPQKLLTTVAVAAQAAIEKGILPGEAIEGICQKHSALGISKDAYAVVGQHILQTIRDLLTEDESILKAWGNLYGEIVSIFVTREAEIAEEISKTPGGWLGRRRFVLVKKEMVSSIIARLTFAPVDQEPVPTLVAGKFTTVWVPLQGEGVHGSFNEQPRHYTLAAPRTVDEEKFLSISVKKEGIVSQVLHEAKLDREWELSAPHGCFVMSGVEKLWLTVPDAPVVFISAGVGLTPVLAMLENVYQTRSVTWLHAARNGQVHAYQDRLRALASVRQGKLQRRVWYSEVLPEDGNPPPSSCSSYNAAKYHFEGRMNLSQGGNAQLLESGILHQGNPHANYFLCGPEGFMTAQMEALVALGVSKHRIHSEGF